MTEEEIIRKIEHQKELARLRSRKHYNLHKEDILKKQKLYNQNIKIKYQEILKAKPVRPVDPVLPVEPVQPVQYHPVQPAAGRAGLP